MIQSLKQLKNMQISNRCLTESLRCCYTQTANINLSDITIIYISFSINVRCFDVSFLFSDKDEMLQKRSDC
jgi:DNA phosphorothioation-dependent restriction protein DptG